jgi:hypothetical protein
MPLETLASPEPEGHIEEARRAASIGHRCARSIAPLLLVYLRSRTEYNVARCDLVGVETPLCNSGLAGEAESFLYETEGRSRELFRDWLAV